MKTKEVTSAPACFESLRQYKNWLALARNVGDSGICTDCTPEYQKQMICQRRCAHPEAKFRMDEDGFIAGFIPGAKAERSKARKLALETI
jgi:hypothetical protein